LLLEIIWHDFALIPWPEPQLSRPFVVNVDMVELHVPSGQSEPASTRHSYHNGGTSKFVHMLKCENIVACTVAVLVPNVDSGSRQTSFDLREVLDSYAVRDSASVHDVHALRRIDEDRTAACTFLLLDFAPLVPDLSVATLPRP
jgi:hypothetical protein